MEFHQSQDIVARDKTKYRVVSCGRQWGKTTLSAWEMFICAYAKQGRRVGYFAPYVSQARDIAWGMLKEITKNNWAKPPNETRLELFIKTRDGGVSEIVLKGFENIESARGQQFDFLVLDEVAKMKRFEEGWQAVLLPTLIFRNGSGLFISTPYGYNHFHKLFLEGQTGNPQYKSYKFTSYDNPFLPKEVIDDARRTTTPDYFQQEYLSEFTRFTGLIYKEFDVTRHVHDFEHTYNQYGDYIFGLDFAVRGWTAALATYINPQGEIYHLDEYKKENLTAKTHSGNIKEILKRYAPLEKWVGYADPAGFAKNQQKGDMIWAIADEYLEDGLSIVPANNEVIAGINYVRQLHKQDKIHAHPRLNYYVEEKLQYQWKDQPEKQVGALTAPEQVRKLNDHVMDTERYELYSKPEAPVGESILPSGMPIIFPAPRIEKPNESNDKITPLDIPGYYD